MRVETGGEQMTEEIASAAPQLALMSHEIVERRQAALCVVGAGPAGVMLSLFLARKGIPVILLEEHMDFDRDFRGDTIHPMTLAALDQIGLARTMLQTLPHSELHSASIETADGPFTPINFSYLHTPFPFVALLPQKDFLAFITEEAARYPNFTLLMGARVEELVVEDGVVRGVRYRGQQGWGEVRALVTVGCDGRFSRLRRLGGFSAITTSSPIDVLWFRLPRREDDPPEALARFFNGRFFVMLNRGDQWQIAYIILKGGYQDLRAQGIEALQQIIAETAPEMADRAHELESWRQVSLLSVASDRLTRWSKPGLLLIGDAAHVMSPVGGVGINYAIQDAIVTANTLYEPLRQGHVTEADLAGIQREREFPTRLIQAIQSRIQGALLPLTHESGQLHVPGWLQMALRLPGVSGLPPYVMGIGFRPAKLRPELIAEEPMSASRMP
jgi:2-polyprenyl-6-methoxyphenol hydroxylase-like FAD-dependent oxidoreductase